jgi:hypothetical protein
VSIEKASGLALGMVKDLTKTIEDKCLSIGMYPAFSKASMDSAENYLSQQPVLEPKITDSFLADNLRYVA